MLNQTDRPPPLETRLETSLETSLETRLETPTPRPLNLTISTFSFKFSNEPDNKTVVPVSTW